MNKLTSEHGSQTYANIVGASGGTLILIIAREIPDTYWIKPYLIFVAPSISVCLSNLTNEIRTNFAGFRRNIRRILKEKKIMREIKALTEYPYVTPEEIYMLNKRVATAKMKN